MNLPKFSLSALVLVLGLVQKKVTPLHNLLKKFQKNVLILKELNFLNTVLNYIKANLFLLVSENLVLVHVLVHDLSLESKYICLL